MTYDDLKQHVLNYFGDKARSAQETREDLIAIAEQCEMLADSIAEADANEA